MKTTTDAILDGAVELEQPAPGEGYRVNVDSIHLARFIAPSVPQGGHVADLGAGVGAVALCLTRLAHPGRLTLVEVDAAACALARRNLLRASWFGTWDVIETDLGAWPAGPLDADVLVGNPPYTPVGHGREAKSERVRSARQGDVRVFLQAATRAATPARTAVALSYPAHALSAVLADASRVGLMLRRAAFVHARPEAPARLALLEWAAGGETAVTVAEPIIESVDGCLHDAPSRG